MATVDWNGVEARGGEVIRPVAWQLAATSACLVTGALLSVGVVALLASDGVGGADPPWVAVWSGVATLAVALAFRNLRRLLRREPLVGYDDTGLHLPGVGTVAWHEISAVTVDEVGRGRSTSALVSIYLHDPPAVLARAGLRRRIEGRIETSSHRAPLAIHPFKLPVELWVLVSRIERRREAALRAGKQRPAQQA